MALIGFLVNYEDPEQRKTMPSGLLVTHENSPVIIGLGESPLSNLLYNLFLSGVEYPIFDKHQNITTAKLKPKDLKTFRSVGSAYLKQARLKLVEVRIDPPLCGELKITAGLQITAGEPFEIVKIRNN